MFVNLPIASEPTHNLPKRTAELAEELAIKPLEAACQAALSDRDEVKHYRALRRKWTDARAAKNKLSLQVEQRDLARREALMNLAGPELATVLVRLEQELADAQARLQEMSHGAELLEIELHRAEDAAVGGIESIATAAQRRIQAEIDAQRQTCLAEMAAAISDHLSILAGLEHAIIRLHSPNLGKQAAQAAFRSA